jgi:S-adenosylmethionine:tRNA ribosyltransferase-isomerase
MKLSDFDYHLPPDRIAQEPAPRRDGSRLLILDRSVNGIRHAVFAELPGLLRPGDLLVLNDTRVIPARLLAPKPSGGTVEVLLLERLETDRREGGVDPSGECRQEWRALVRGFPKTREGGGIEFPGGLRVAVTRREPGGEVARVVLESESALEEILERFGRAPTPPYIRRGLRDPRLEADRARYQTVYAARPGAVAAPTAGLHFTARLLDEIRTRGIRIGTLTLHVGWGTFQPVRTERLEEHRMHAEWFSVPEQLSAAADSAHRAGGRIVAVGTTVVRALEYAAGDEGRIRAGDGFCDLFIRPGHRFRVVDALVTNFHLPRSTLLALVAAFAGRARTLEAYNEAIERGYRFYSYGDAMVIL